ncbi:MAG TPA: hypothetical protein VF605_12650 [Allosphingosinicella sp.]|jgi:hypothetical protein
MSQGKVAVLLALSGLLLASCGNGDPAAGNNASAEANRLESASPPGPGPGNDSQVPEAESVPPPDAVSHPNGFLPYGEDSPAPSAPEPADLPGAGESPPATEDEYTRNRQAGR